MAEHRPDFQPPRLDPLVAGPPRFGAGARTLIVAGMVGACGMGAVAGTWARPEVSDLKQAKEARPSAAKAAPARPVLQIVDADLMPLPAERMEVLPAWVEVPIPPAVEAGPLRKVVLEKPTPLVPPEPASEPKVKPEAAKAERSKAEKVEASAKPKLIKAKVGAEEKPKLQKAKAEPKAAVKLVKAKVEKPKAEKPKLKKAKPDEPEAPTTKAKNGPRLIKAKLEKPEPKPVDKKKPKAAPAKAEPPNPSKLRVARSKLKPAKEDEETVVVAAPAKLNKVEKVQKELAALSALPVETKKTETKKVVVAEAKPKPKPKRAAPEQPSCAARSRAEALLCENPQLAAADRRLVRAYREAAEAGAPEWRLRRQQNRWLAARERAADQAPWAVAEVYDARIAELEDEAAIARERY